MGYKDLKGLEKEADSMKKIAFFGIAVSTVATITAVIAIPTLYSYMHHIRASLEVEVDFCQVRTGGLFDEFEKVSALRGVRGRIKRAILHRHAGIVGRRYSVPRALIEVEEVPQCCSCNIGPPGPAGPPGPNGKDGW
uniref:Nematode cuticle collagen N-terminal domain-containing protein n=1 Tax=Parascaris equorum TaxID=6256 RepID=A0A914S4W3_PAREQ